MWDFQDAPTSDQEIPNPSPRSPMALHVHHILLPYIGMPIVDNADLEVSGADCSPNSGDGNSNWWWLRFTSREQPDPP